jgi:hypothetical protein
MFHVKHSAFCSPPAPQITGENRRRRPFGRLFRRKQGMRQRIDIAAETVFSFRQKDALEKNRLFFSC